MFGNASVTLKKWARVTKTLYLSHSSPVPNKPYGFCGHKAPRKKEKEKKKKEKKKEKKKKEEKKERKKRLDDSH